MRQRCIPCILWILCIFCILCIPGGGGCRGASVRAPPTSSPTERDYGFWDAEDAGMHPLLRCSMK